MILLVAGTPAADGLDVSSSQRCWMILLSPRGDAALDLIDQQREGVTGKVRKLHHFG